MISFVPGAPGTQCTLCSSGPLILVGTSKCTLHVQVHFCASCAPSAPCALYSHTFSKMHQSAHSADLCTLCTLCTLYTPCTSEPLIILVHQSAHDSKQCTFVHLEHPVHPVHGAPDCHIFLKMHQSAHSAVLCTLCTLCTQYTLRASEPLFLDSSSKCTRYIMSIFLPECTICRYVHFVHPMHYVHLNA
jgi:hypothetical protein